MHKERHAPLRDTDDSSPAHDPIPQIQLRNVCWGYGEGGVWREVLKGVDLDVRAAEQIALLGRSGSGKSTLLHLIAALDQPSAGSIRCDGTDLTTLAEPGRTLWRRRHVGFIFQFFNLIPTLTVLENAMLPLEMSGIGRARARRDAAELLGEVGLADRASAYPDCLSGGEQQRVAIVRALVHRPKLVLADEPTGNLDAQTGERVLDLIDRLVRAQGHTLLLVTHSDEVTRRADRIVRLVDGRLLTQP